MIKILHTSDWHLGKIIYGMSLLEEQENFVYNTLPSIINKEKPDAIIIAGDVFDRQIASVEAIKLFDKFISLIQKEYSVPITVITGNHDSKDRMVLAKKFLKLQNIHISTEIQDAFDFIDIKNDGKIVRLHPLPYFDLSAAKIFLGNDEITYAAAYKKIVNLLEKNFAGADKNILISHCFACGTGNSQDYDEAYVGNLASIGCESFEKFDYTALGHIHKAQTLNGKIHYSGAPIKVSFDEPELSKSVTIIEISDEVIIREVPIVPIHDMKIIKGKFKDVIELGKYHPSEDYILISLEDKNPVYMPVEQLRVYYKNILSLQYSSSFEPNDFSNNELNEALICNKNADEKHILNTFFESVCHMEFDEEFYQIFNKACDAIKD